MRSRRSSIPRTYIKLPLLSLPDYWLCHPLIMFHQGTDVATWKYLSDFAFAWLLGVGWIGLGFESRMKQLIRCREAWRRLGVIDRLADAPHLSAIDWREAIDGERLTGRPRGGFSRSVILRELEAVVGPVVDEELAQSERILESVRGSGNSFEDIAYELGGARVGYDRAVALLDPSKSNREKTLIAAGNHFPEPRIRMLAWCLGGQCRTQLRFPTAWLKAGMEWTCSNRPMRAIRTRQGLIVSTREMSWPAESMEFVPIDRSSLQQLLPKRAPRLFAEVEIPF